MFLAWLTGLRELSALSLLGQSPDLSPQQRDLPVVQVVVLGSGGEHVLGGASPVSPRGSSDHDSRFLLSETLITSEAGSQRNSVRISIVHAA